MSLPPLLYQGSAKNVRGEVGSEVCFFEFTNRYSIYDWGEMPDHLEHKGESLAFMAQLFFEHLSQEHYAHHFLERTQENLLKVKTVKVIPPVLTARGHDYSSYQENVVDALVPLEVIFRFGVPQGSSLLKRLERDPVLLKQYGLSQIPEPGTWLERPIIEFSTKLESSDRMLADQQAQKIAGLSTLEFEELKHTALSIAKSLSKLISGIGLELWDGKLEFAFRAAENGRSFELVDAIGLDELRILWQGKQLSKEYLRQAYQQSEWLAEVHHHKEVYGRDWKRFCKRQPERLTPEIKRKIENLYMGFTNKLAEVLKQPEPFAKLPSWEQTLEEL